MASKKSPLNIKHMKRFTLFFASLTMLISLNLSAQNERLLLLESFTNTGCGPCAAYNPAMDALIAANPDKVVAIKYHVNWPSATDPMYLHNTSENGSRTSYYGVTSVPHVVIDGTRFSGNPSQLNQNIINQLQAIESPIEMRLSYAINEADNTITVNVMGRATSAIQGNLRLFVGVIEREIHFNSAPGSNGERDFYNVMKKLLPGSTGLTIGNLDAGQYFAYTFTWELANIYDMSQVDAMAWVQNSSSKEVFQACKSSQDIEPFYANEACASNISNVKSVICSGVANPKFVLSNYGSNNLTSADLDIIVNEEVVKTMQWTGNLPTFASETVDLGEISFPVDADNTLEVSIKTTNGVADEAPSNNIATLPFDGAPMNVAKVLKLTVRTDENPQETSWKVTNMLTGEVVIEGGPYDEPNHKYEITLEIAGDGCYDFTIYDAGGNGLSGTGIYGLKAGGTTLFSGRDFGYSESNEFAYEVTADVEETLQATTSIYPNPTSGLVNIISEGEQSVVIYNMAGQRVFAGQCESYLQIDMKAYGAGIYAIKVGNETQRVVVK